jgi:DNA (cytosine-5)-methyltransferase 1
MILSLFPGIGLLDMGFEDAGYCVVRGPDVLWGGDIRRFHPPTHAFEGVVGGPPCQAFSRLANMVKLNHAKNPEKYHLAENLIPEFERCVIEARPTWFLMENVPDAPNPEIPGFHIHTFLLNNRWIPDSTPQNRLRRFWFGHCERKIDLRQFIDYALLESHEFTYTVLASGTSKTLPVAMNSNGKPKRLLKNLGSTRSVSEMATLQGLPDDFLDDAPFTVAGKRRVIGNGVPVPMARAIARAIRLATEVCHAN